MLNNRNLGIRRVAIDDDVKADSNEVSVCGGMILDGDLGARCSIIVHSSSLLLWSRGNGSGCAATGNWYGWDGWRNGGVARKSSSSSSSSRFDDDDTLDDDTVDTVPRADDVILDDDDDAVYDARDDDDALEWTWPPREEAVLAILGGRSLVVDLLTVDAVLLLLLLCGVDNDGAAVAIDAVVDDESASEEGRLVPKNEDSGAGWGSVGCCCARCGCFCSCDRLDCLFWRGSLMFTAATTDNWFTHNSITMNNWTTRDIREEAEEEYH